MTRYRRGTARHDIIIIIIIIVYYATKAANIHSYTYKNTIKNKTKFKKDIKILNMQNALMHRQVQVIKKL